MRLPKVMQNARTRIFSLSQPQWMSTKKMILSPPANTTDLPSGQPASGSNHSEEQWLAPQQSYNYQQLNMQLKQQKQHNSDDQFESLPAEVETINNSKIYQVPHLTKPHHPRNKPLSEKQKLGLIISPQLSQPNYSPAPSRPALPSHGKVIQVGSFTFRSNFESGSIGAVDLIGNNSFKISLDLESNSSRGNSWFYFTVEGVKGEANFLIKGFTKKSSLYNKGMKICYRDRKEPTKWRRGGTHLSYEPFSETEDEDRCYCLKFSFFFKTNEHSSIQFAYSFPYSFQKLNLFLTQIHNKVKCGILGHSYEGRNIPLVTLGNPSSKQLIVVSARVHPGETGSSFIVEGFLRQLTSDSQYAKYLRQRFFIKVVPMINVDGVCRGNYRFSAVGVDLNRKWKQPNPEHHPEVFLLKEMIKRQNSERKLRMFIDMHGHSRKKNVFFYGCCEGAQSEEESTRAKAFPFLMGKIHNPYNYEDCSFSVQKDKEGTARVSLYNEFKINEIFTLEASFCGPTGGSNFTQPDYEKLGRKLCEGMCVYFYEPRPEETNPKIPLKLLALKQNSIKELESSPYFLKVGNQQNSGSDSDPEKGEMPQKLMKSSASKQDCHRKRTSNTSAHYYNRTMPKIPSSLKQKSQTSQITEEKDMRERELFMYLVEAPSQLLETDFKNKELVFNQRVHSTSKQSHYKNSSKHNRQRKSNYGNYGEDYQSLNADKSDKTKVNLMVSREGAQYRRVRKIAEQSIKQDYTEPSMIQVKGIQGSRLQVDNRNSVNKVIAQQKSKYRRTSAEMFFRKPIRMDEKVDLGRKQINVLCRGKQILF